MKNKLGILIIISLLLGCVTSKDVEQLSLDKRILYPIGEDGKWGYANQDGETVIEPIFDEIEFFKQGLGLVKSNGKYGYLKKDGTWQLKPKYDSGTSFNNYSNYAIVSIKNDTFCIDRKGKRLKRIRSYPIDSGVCKRTNAVNPEKYFFKVDGKYETEYPYYLVDDSSNSEKVVDTSNLKIDQVEKYSNEHILISRNNKYGFYNIWPKDRIVIKTQEDENFKETAKVEFLKRINFKYDEVKFERSFDNEVTYAKARINDKWGVLGSRGSEIIEVKYNSLTIKKGWQMALVEFEPGKFGYKTFNGKEFFKREE